MFEDRFDDDFEMAIIKIQQGINVAYDDAILLGNCIAHAYFEIEGDAMILANKFDLTIPELAALTGNKGFYQKESEEYYVNKFVSACAE
jgi:hypothetical protein